VGRKWIRLVVLKTRKSYKVVWVFKLSRRTTVRKHFILVWTTTPKRERDNKLNKENRNTVLFNLHQADVIKRCFHLILICLLIDVRVNFLILICLLIDVRVDSCLWSDFGVLGKYLAHQSNSH